MTGATVITKAIAGERALVIDCRHATTTIVVTNGTGAGAPQISDVAAVRMGLARHHAEQGCGCTRALRRRYGPVG